MDIHNMYYGTCNMQPYMGFFFVKRRDKLEKTVIIYQAKKQSKPGANMKIGNVYFFGHFA
jgi:hypothetical protein